MIPQIDGDPQGGSFAMRPVLRGVLGWAVALVAIVGPVVAEADEVRLTEGSALRDAINAPRVSGEIVEESPTEVVVRRPGRGETRVPLDQIAVIRYSNEPVALRQARTRESGGGFERAAELYEEALQRVGATEPFIAQVIQVGRIRCLIQLSARDQVDSSEVVRELETFLRDYPDGRHQVEVLQLLAQWQIENSQFDEADEAIARLERTSRGADRAAILGARLLAAQDDHDRALTRLKRVINRSTIDESLRREAQLAQAVSLAASDRIAEAEPLVRQVIQSLPPEDAQAQAQAFNTLGDCQLEAGRPKDALIAYLHTDLLYAQNRREHPKALARLVMLWRQLGKPGRADQALQQLQQDYPESPWTQRAQDGSAARPE